MSQYHFETMQIHVGQEHPDPATGARAGAYLRHHLLRV